MVVVFDPRVKHEARCECGWSWFGVTKRAERNSAGGVDNKTRRHARQHAEITGHTVTLERIETIRPLTN